MHGRQQVVSEAAVEEGERAVLVVGRAAAVRGVAAERRRADAGYAVVLERPNPAAAFVMKPVRVIGAVPALSMALRPGSSWSCRTRYAVV